MKKLDNIETLNFDDVFIGIEVYYKITYGITISNDILNTTNQIHVKQLKGSCKSHILFEVHKNDTGYYVYNFIAKYDLGKQLKNLNAVKSYMINYINIMIGGKQLNGYSVSW